MINNKPITKEDYAIVLDIINNNYGYNDKTILQVLGTRTFVLLEVVQKPEAEVKIGERIYIGDGKRDKILFIKRTLFPTKLTEDAKRELEFIIEDIVKEREDEYINFLNKAGPITIRKHSLEIIPGIGKKHLQEILNERNKEPFKNYEDLSKRCPFISNPVKAITERIVDEIFNRTDIKFFVGLKSPINQGYY